MVWAEEQQQQQNRIGLDALRLLAMLVQCSCYFLLRFGSHDEDGCWPSCCHIDSKRALHQSSQHISAKLLLQEFRMLVVCILAVCMAYGHVLNEFCIPSLCGSQAVLHTRTCAKHMAMTLVAMW